MFGFRTCNINFFFFSVLFIWKISTTALIMFAEMADRAWMESITTHAFAPWVLAAITAKLRN